MGKQTVYTIVKMLVYSWDGREVFYFCRDQSGEYVIMRVCFKDPPSTLGEDMFFLRNACLSHPLLKDHIGHETWFPVIEEVVSVPMGLEERPALILRLDTENTSKLVVLGTFFEQRRKWFDMPTAVWIMRELVLITQLGIRYKRHIAMDANRLLIDPEQKRLFVLDFRPGKRLDPGDIEMEMELMQELCGLLRSLCKQVISCCYGRVPCHDFEFRDEFQGENFKQLEKELRSGSRELNSILDVLNKLAIELKVAEHPFTMQDESLLERVSSSGSEWYGLRSY